MADTYFFNGRTYSTPTVMSQINDNAELPANQPTGNVVAFLGQCLGGQPATPMVFGSPDALLAALFSGDLVTAGVKAFAVSDDDAVNAPSSVVVVPVISANTTQGFITVNTLKLFTSIFGSATSSMLIEATPGSLYGNALGVQFNGMTKFSDNVADLPFVITNGSVSLLTLGAVAKQATTINVMLGATAFPVSLRDAGGNYLTLAGFVASFNSAFIGTGVSCTIGSVAGPLAQNTPIDQVLDVTTATPTVAVGTSYQYVTVMHALEWFFLSSGFFTQTPTGATFVPWTINSPTGVAPAVFNFGYTLLGSLSATQWAGTNGTTAAVTNADWALALAALQNQDVQWLTPLTVSPSVWAMGDAHCQFMATLGKERRQIVGPDIGTTQAAAQQMAFNLNSNRTAVAWPGHYDFNPSGVLTLYNSEFTAANAAAAFAGMAPGEPLTNKTFTWQGMETPLAVPTQTDELIQAGIMCFVNETTGYTCVRSVSTWLQDEKYDKVELSVGFAADTVCRQVRAACKPYNGGRNSPYALGRVLAAAEAALNAMAVPDPLGPGLIVGDSNSPAWTNLKGTLTGDVIAVSFDCSPVLPNNFISITASIAPYSGSQTLSST